MGIIGIPFTEGASKHFSSLKDESIPSIRRSKVDYQVALTKQEDSLFLQIFPTEIYANIFNFLEKKDLASMHLVSRFTNSVAIELFLKELEKSDPYFMNFEEKFVNLNKEIDTLLNYWDSSGYNNNLKHEMDKLEKTSKDLSKFRIYCIFLLNNTSENGEKITNILDSICRLQAACQYKIEINQKSQKGESTESYYNEILKRQNDP